MVTGTMLHAIDKQKNLAVYNAIDGIIHIVCTYIFVAMPSVNVYGFMIGNLASSLVGTVLNSVTVAKYAKFKFDFMQWLILPALAGIYTGFMTYFTYNFCIRLSVIPAVSIIIAVLFSIIIYASVLELRNISIVRYILNLKTQE
jgi:stage V sporulation protein B